MCVCVCMCVLFHPKIRNKSCIISDMTFVSFFENR